MQILSYHLKLQKRRLLLETGGFDAIAPDGFDNIDEPVIIEIRYGSLFRTISSGAKFLTSAKQRAGAVKCLLILSEKLTDGSKVINRKEIDADILIWGIDEINRIYRKHKKQFPKNWSNNLIDVVNDPETTSWLERKNNEAMENQEKDAREEISAWKDRQLELLRTAYQKGELALFLGAGISRDSKIPGWGDLLKRIRKSILDHWCATNIENPDDSVREILNKVLDEIWGTDYILLSLYYELRLGDVFPSVVNTSLFEDYNENTILLDRIADFCNPENDSVGVRAVITYNFDDLLEEAFNRADVSYSLITRKTEKPDSHDLPVYHVHGFSQRNFNPDNDYRDTLVFSEMGYFGLIRDPYHWANLVQLHYLRENTCLLIGFSMTDPNQRRLLRISAENEEYSRHSVILEKKEAEEYVAKDSGLFEVIKQFLDVHYKTFDESLKDLGVDVLWVRNYSEIPDRLRSISQ